MKLMRRVRRNVQRLSRDNNQFPAAEGCLYFALEQDEGFFKVVTMRRRAATWRDVHIHYAEAASGLLATYGDGIGIADQADLRKVRILVRPG